MPDISLPGLVVDLEAKIDKLERGLQKANRAQRRSADAMERRAKQSADRINSTYGGMASKLTGTLARMAAPVAATLGSAATARAIRDTAKAVAQIGDEAARAGVPLEAFQEWTFVAQQNRISADALTDGLKELSLRTDEFITTGAGPAADALQRLGFGAEELREKLEDPSELMLEIIARTRRLDRAAQIRIADEIFGGTGGEQFVQLLAEGEDGLRRTIERAHEVGAVLDREMIDKADEVSRKYDELAARVGNFGKRVAVGVAEGLVEIADMRARLEEIFDTEDQGRAMLGDRLYDALDADRDQTDAAGADLAQLERQWQAVAQAANQSSMVMAQASQQMRAYGYGELADEMGSYSGAMRDLSRRFLDGSIEGDTFAAKLAEIEADAKMAFDQLHEADRISFTAAIGQVDALGAAIARAIGLAASLKGAVEDVAGTGSGADARLSQLRQFREADAQSRANFEAYQERQAEFLASEEHRNALSKEELALERATADARERAAAAGVQLTEQQARAAGAARLAADQARIAAEAGASQGGGGGGGGREPQLDDYERELQAIRDETTALDLEAAALAATAAAGRRYAGAIEEARREAELLHAAQRAGITITPQVRSQIEAEALSYGEAARAAEDAAAKIEGVQEAREQLRSTAKGAFVDLVTGAQSFEGALQRVIGRLAEMAASNVFEMMVTGGMQGAGGNGESPAWLTNLLGFADGGWTGAGRRSEPAGIVHRGEFVLSKPAVERIGVAQLETLHQSALKGYATGGLVGPAAAPKAGLVGAHAGQQITISAPVTVNGSAGSPEQNADLAKRMAREMRNTMRQEVAKEIRQATRPGNMLGRR